ncbi:ALG3 protein-domain-containing protein [Rhypophila decipiens]|uniref:Dol-P-Man:Man(5)GlcNAc(2)-PP-Dol alpha-1,3-mannosyltransferase n=1 Tax=Rhypophila decipiens TaxID=261697 RepID=A0AAN6XZ98_9PEZI|nr:ALG3 protein-domain-containing protein [Rhypophila decipiens]
MAVEKDSRWERRTWPRLEHLAKEVPEAGIHFQKSRVLRRDKDIVDGHCKGPLSDGLSDPNPWYKTLMPDFRELSASELPAGYQSGCEFTSRATLKHISEAKKFSHTGKPADIIVNATGLLASKLGGVMDSKVRPARGQIVVVRNESGEPASQGTGTMMVITSGNDDGEEQLTYVMQRAVGGGTILGGTYQRDNWDANPDHNIAVGIMKRAVQVMPELTGGKGIKGLDIIRHGVGLKPYRDGGVTTEKEKIDGTWVVHNYGHSGWGYQGSYGCAEGVVELVDEIVGSKANKLELENASSPRMSTFFTSSSIQQTQVGANMADSTKKSQPIYVQAIGLALDIANGRHFLSKLIPPALLLVDTLLCALVIWKVPYTEIDWKAYMEQISQYVSGERDYTKIYGGTGPLVYPAFHVYIYTALYYLTDHGTDIFLAQQLFAVLYLTTLSVVMLCYWQAKVPPYVFLLLVLPKRLHSIFVLRCFNDCFAIGALLYTLGVGIKMTLLLALPAVGVVIFLGTASLGKSLELLVVMVAVQVLIGVPFLVGNTAGYLGRAFELSRQFFFKWTVNWRFVGEERFLSKEFALALLGLHILTLGIFITTRWLKPTRKSFISLVTPVFSGKAPFTRREEAEQVQRAVTPRYITTTILSANVLGLLFARSLHYQFYAYLAWSTPFLLWRSGVNPLVQYLLFFAQEWAWNVYPSTNTNSAVVVGVLAITVGLVWWGAREDSEPRDTPLVEKSEKAKR